MCEAVWSLKLEFSEFKRSMVNYTRAECRKTSAFFWKCLKIRLPLPADLRVKRVIFKVGLFRAEFGLVPESDTSEQVRKATRQTKPDFKLNARKNNKNKQKNNKTVVRL